MKRTLWIDTHTSYDQEKLTNTEYNLREDIQCLKEDIRELVDALRFYPDNSLILDDRIEYTCPNDEHVSELMHSAELVAKHGDK